MRDLEKERELLNKAGLDDLMVFSAVDMAAMGLAHATGADEALAATVGGQAEATESISRPRASEFQAGLAEPWGGRQRGPEPWYRFGETGPATRAKHNTPSRKSHRKPASAHAAERRTDAETPLKALARLRREAGDAIEQLLALLDDIEGDPDLEAEDEHGGDINDGGEDDDDGEPSLAVPEIPHWQSQTRLWSAACRSRLRDQELEPNLGADCREHYSQDVYLGLRGADPSLEELETDLDVEEADELEEKGERDLPSTECINQEHIAQGDWRDRDGEMNLASTNSIDQRWSHAGSRTDREADAFPYDPPRRSGEFGVSDWERMQRARQETREELRRRGLGEAAAASNVVLLNLLRR